MSENLHNIDQLFKDGIEGQEEAPSSRIWDELDKKLDKKNVASIAGKYRKLKWVAAALFLFSVGMGMYAYHVHKNTLLVQTEKKRNISPKTGQRLQSQDESGDLSTGILQKDTQLVEPDMQTNRKDNAHINGLPAAKPADSKHTALTDSSLAVKENEKIREESTLDDAGQSTVPKNDALIIENPRRYPGHEHITGNSSLSNKFTLATHERQSRSHEAGKDSNVSASILKNGTKKNGGSMRTNETVQGNNGIQHTDVYRELHPVIITSSTVNRVQGIIGYPNIMMASGHAPAAVTFLPPSAATLKLTPVRQTGFTVTALFSPNAVSNKVTSNEQQNIPTPRPRDNDPKKVREKEQNSSSWSAGLLLGYNFNQHWRVESGLVLSTRITVVQPQTIFARPDDHGNIRYLYNCSSGFSFIDLKQSNAPAMGDSANAVSSRNKLQYLSVPLSLKYAAGNRKLQFNTSIGLQTNILVSRKIDTYITKGIVKEYATTNDMEGLRSMYISGLISAGISYKLNRTFTASLSPNAQIGFMSINRTSLVRSYINFYGIAAGVSVKL